MHETRTELFLLNDECLFDEIIKIEQNFGIRGLFQWGKPVFQNEPPQKEESIQSNLNIFLDIFIAKDDVKGQPRVKVRRKVMKADLHCPIKLGVYAVTTLTD